VGVGLRGGAICVEEASGIVQQESEIGFSWRWFSEGRSAW
jgi:hypothetical protein